MKCKSDEIWSHWDTITGCLLRGSLFTEILCILLDEGKKKTRVNKSTGNGSKMHERLWSMDSKCPFVGSRICKAGFVRVTCMTLCVDSFGLRRVTLNYTKLSLTPQHVNKHELCCCFARLKHLTFCILRVWPFFFFLLFIDVSSSPVTLAYFVSYSLNFSSLGLSGDCRKITLSW